MRPYITKILTTVLLMPMILLAGSTASAVAQGVAANPSAAQGVRASSSAALARPGSQPATASVPHGPAQQSWVGYRSAQPVTTSQPAAKTDQKAHATVNPTARTKTAQPHSGWTGYGPSAAWSSYRPGTARVGTTSPATSRLTTAPATSRPVNQMDRSRVSGPSPYHGNQPRSYHEYGSGRRVSLAKPWLPGSP
jgi:hypothetical protein